MPRISFDGLGCLQCADDPGQHAEDSTFGARGNQSGRRRLRIQASIARPAGIAEYADLPLEAENRTVDVRLAEENASVVHQVARGEIVGAIDDDVVIAEEVERILAGQPSFVLIDLNVGIQSAKARGSCFDFWPADVRRAEKNLALQVGQIDLVEVDEANAAHTGGGEIQAERRAQPSRADTKNFSPLELELPIHADFGHDQMAAVAEYFFVRKGRGRGGCDVDPGGHGTFSLFYS